MQHKITPATLSWNNEGEPYSDLFDDVYFSGDNGLEESRYVFIEQNDLVNRWQQCQESFYVIAETGFGSGLNLLATCLAFESFRHKNPQHSLQRLYFISFEKFPLTAQDLLTAHARWPQVQSFATQLQQHYPSAIAGCHRININLAAGEIVLDLWLGDISDTLPQLNSPADGLIDSWFLDGFAPSKNPQMWTPQLYKNIAKITKNQASLATFTAAADVRRGLQACGFVIKPVTGFGKKRQMITAKFERTNNTSSTPSWYHRPAGQQIEQVTIIGGGIASAALCLALAKRGIKIRLICNDSELAQGASGNRQGGFYPLINSQHDYLSQLYSQAFLYGRQTLNRLRNQGYQFNGEFCGALLLGYEPKLVKRFQQLAESQVFPSDFVQWLTADSASVNAGVDLADPALYFPQAAWLCPKQITNALIEKAQSMVNVEILFNTAVSKISNTAGYWDISTSNLSYQAQHLVLANGHKLCDFAQTRALNLYQTSGQVSDIATTAALAPLKTLLCYKGYLTPQQDQTHCIGASFEQHKTTNQLTETEQAQNIDKLISCTNSAAWATSIKPQTLTGKVGIRLSAKDHLPMVGGVPQAEQTQKQFGDLARGKPATKYPPAPHYDNLFMIGALGSRGLCSAMLLAEILACQLTNQPQPVSQSLLNQLNPNRYWIKQLKSGNDIL